MTTDPNDPRLKNIKPNGQQEAYLVLSEEERAKGFARPVRNKYKHVGRPGPKNPLRDLTPEEYGRYDKYGYVKFEEYPPSVGSSALGRYWTQKELDSIDKGCGVVTTMGRDIAETYARNPSYYGATFCCGCGTHLRVGADGEFVWDEDGSRVGT